MPSSHNPDTVTIKLPEAFVTRMSAQLGDEINEFLHSYEAPRTQGMRLNPLKMQPPQKEHPVFGELERRFGLEPVPWCPTGYYYKDDARPGKLPYHSAGVYYMQEPSAMSSAELLAPVPGDIVLDLAAAPGGKSTQLAGMLQGQGLLLANEIHPARAKILSENIERSGIRNAVVTSSTPDQLAARFPSFFDKIMLDTPCSGEGMFRKDEEARGEWSPEHVEMCATRQLDILDSAAVMLKPGGLLAYSTCTFNREENEDVLEAFTSKHPDYAVLRTERIWPHRQRGEGHFVALLHRQGDTAAAGASLSASGRSRDRETPAPKRRGGTDAGEAAAAAAMRETRAFLAQALPGLALGPGEPVLFGEQLYWLPHAEGCPFRAAALDGLRVLRPGLHLAAVKKGRVEPAHALALACAPQDVPAQARANYRADDATVAAYLRGEALPAADGLAGGWCVVAVDGFPLGWGKASDGQIKNHYPKGLRWMGH
ncbi:RsmB/NOP family class I SAM-dependent RNA methyltransferase [Paenibacillus sp. HJGM_3]|uniref:RsmB/NOP family class I SAM-dependent RNA methyltransferase n=1 Tax=Paenibacillus sp. HJGM_3 TaxID=3379816 RepID=UPI00385F0C35